MYVFGLNHYLALYILYLRIYIHIFRHWRRRVSECKKVKSSSREYMLDPFTTLNKSKLKLYDWQTRDIEICPFATNESRNQWWKGWKYNSRWWLSPVISLVSTHLRSKGPDPIFDRDRRVRGKEEKDRGINRVAH